MRRVKIWPVGKYVSHPPIGNPENMDAVIQYGAERYEHLGAFLKRILPKIDEEVLAQMNVGEASQENILNLAMLLREQIAEEYQSVPVEDQKMYKFQAHEALRGIIEIARDLGMPREIHKEIDIALFPGETQNDLKFIGTIQTIREGINNSSVRVNEMHNASIPTEEDMQRRVI